MTATEWNQKYPIGTRIRYTHVKRHDSPEESVTVSPAVLDPYGVVTVCVKDLPRPVWVGALTTLEDWQ